MTDRRTPTRLPKQITLPSLALLILVFLVWRCAGVNPATSPVAPTASPAATVQAQAAGAEPTTRPTNKPAGTPARRPTAKPAIQGTLPPEAPVPGLAIPTPPPNEGLRTIRFELLPSEAKDVIRLIARGGPFPYRQDGVTFQNRERLLPGRTAGYYKEYTVATPGSPDRGPRRIVGGEKGELYYTDDHYASFKRVVP